MKMKKLLVSIFAAAMILSTMGMVAFAEDATLGKSYISTNTTYDLANTDTLTVNGQVKVQDSATLTINGGNVTVSNFTGDWAFYAGGGDIVFNNVNFTASSLRKYLLMADYGHSITFNNSTITLTDAEALFYNDFAKGILNLNNTKVYLPSGCQRVALGTNSVVNLTNGSLIEADGLTNHAFRNVDITVENSTIDIDGCETGIKNSDGSKVTVTGDSTIAIANAKGTDAPITLSGGSTMSATSEVKITVEGEAYEGADAIAAKIGDTYYATLTDAFAAITDGATVTIFEGTYNENVSFDADNVTIIGNGNVTIKGKLTAGSKGTLTMAAVNFDIQNINIEVEEGQAVDISGNGKFFKCNIKSGENAIAWAVARSDEGYGLTFENCNIEATGRAIHFDTLKTKLTVNGGTVKGEVGLASGTPAEFNGVTFDSDSISFWGSATLTGCTFAPTTTIIAELDSSLVLINGCTVSDCSDVFALLNTESKGGIVVDGSKALNRAAKIGDTFYASLQDALTAADDNDVIDLMGNVIVIKDDPLDPVNGRRYYDVCGKPVIIKNGTIDLTGTDASDSVFRFEDEDDAVTFENVKFIREASEPETYICYFVNIHTSSNAVEFIGCEFDIDQFDSSFIANTAGGSVTIKNCTGYIDDGNFLYRGGALIEDSTFICENGNFLNHNAYPTTIKNSTIVTNRLGVIEEDGTIALTEGTSVRANEVDNYYPSTSDDYSTGHITVDETSSLIADNINMDLINPASEGTIISKADSIEVVFEKADVDAQGVDNKEGEDLYNINLVATNKEIINRLNSADLTFTLSNTTGKTEFEIIASNEEVVVAPVNNSTTRYEFHYNGKDGVKTDVANTITIGQVKFTGYGAYTFAVDTDATTNVAHATTLEDNIVDTFVPNDDTTTVALGKLVIDNSVINAEILVPTRDLVINVTFPNAINNNAAAYQDMTVTVSGADLEADLVVELGENGEITPMDTYVTKTSANKAVTAVFADGAYKVTVTDLLNVNTAYTVTVEGAGYRTARYTVTMNCDEYKTLNFWNNVKDNAFEVEEGKASSAKNVTFLAGDIVKDGNINIYDLSAVVSYFGEIDLNVAGTENAYAKYDLNRDGKIDSKDVAYVLVSWGK